MYRILIGLAVLLVAFPSVGSAQDAPAFRAFELYEMCTSSYDTDFGYCAGYVTAIAHTMTQQPVGGHQACNFSFVRSQQFVDIFKTYSEQFRDSMDTEAGHVVAASIARAFPCHNRP